MLGNSNDYIINDENYSLSIRDQAYMDDEDYEKLIDNPQKYLWEDFLPKKFSVLKNHENSVDFRAFVNKYLEFGGALEEIGQIVASHGGADFSDPDGLAVAYICGYELLFNNIRGMRKLSMDLRRRPGQVEAAVQALDEFWSIPRLERVYQQPKGTNPNYCVDTNPVLLGHIILSPKQFEKFYWPHLERVAKCAEERDKLIYFFVEGSSKRFWDFFRELPENHCVYHRELDDIFEAKEALPNCVMAGGMPVSLLGRGTPEQCVEYTKELIDRLGGEDHRYVFAPEKMISFPQDCKSENLKAICDYLNSVKY